MYLEFVLVLKGRRVVLSDSDSVRADGAMTLARDPYFDYL